MKMYKVLVKQLGIGDGKTYKRGARLRADQFTRGKLAGGLRAKHIAECGDVLAEPVAQSCDSTSDAEVDPVDELLEVPAEDPHTADDVSGSADTDLDPLDAAIATLAGVDGEALAALQAAELLCIGDAVEHLAEHGSFIGIEGIGKGRDKQLQKALAVYMPAAAEEETAAA